MLLEPNSEALSARRFLAAVGIWHVAFVLALFFVGRTQILPQTFDSNGIGVSFAIDSRSYRVEAEDMAKLIQQGRVRDWISYNASFHVKLYSLSFALIGRLVGFNILAAEPLNLLYYVSILALAHFIAREALGHNVARFATGLIALWPSLLLHTTQMLRDALFIPSMLLLALALLLGATRTLSLKQGFLVAIPGAVAVLLAWLCRGDMWEMVLTILIIGAVICVLAQLKERRFSLGNTLAIGAILVITFWIPRVVPTYRQTNDLLSAPLRATQGGELVGNESQQKENMFNATEKPQTPLSKLARRVGLLRHKFIIRYPLAGSNIDTGIELQGTSDIVRYLPRAALIGFFSPFPNMWLTTGAQVGLAGRLVSGAEMLLMYPILGLAGFALVREPRRLSVWLLFSIASVGCIALGCVVVNISTLYRMRYAFFIILIILGMKGLLYFLPVGSGAKVELTELQARLN